MKSLLLFAIFLILGVTDSYGHASTYHLAIGETWSLETTPLQDLQIEKKGIVSVKDQHRRLIFTGKKLGKTKLRLGAQSYQLEVIRKPVREAQLALEPWLENKRGPKLQVKADQVVIAGRLLTLKDFISLGELSLPKGSFVLKAKADSQLKEEINSHLSQLMHQNNLIATDIKWRPHWHINIQNHFKSEKSRYQSLLENYGVKVNLDANQLTQRPVIHIQVYVAHIKKNFLREWGVEWPSQVSTHVLSTQHTDLEAFQVSLRSLETTGQGQLLATPSLLIESGEKGEFHSGGEFPIRTTTQFNNNVQWKSYGLFVKAQPKSNGEKHLHINIDIEMSALDQNLNSDGVPALQRSHIKTQVHMKRPTPVLISGFSKQEVSSGRSGLPWLQQIPIFKPLFSNGQIYNDELDLVFILVPSFQD